MNVYYSKQLGVEMQLLLVKGFPSEGASCEEKFGPQQMDLKEGPPWKTHKRPVKRGVFSKGEDRLPTIMFQWRALHFREGSC